jgi:SAM-dependent methyltransferase
MSEQNTQERYQRWYAREDGLFALSRCRTLLHGLLSGWPRRNRSLLAFNAGSGDFLDVLWEAGFDVTAQDSAPEYLDRARQALGKRADFVLSSPDHLPFDDDAFDYAVAVAALEFWEHPEAVLEEMARLACNGVILIFPNALSVFGLECLLRRGHPLCAAARPLLRSPAKVYHLARKVFIGKKYAWRSILLGPSPTWHDWPLFSLLNSKQAPVPFGAFAGLRVDFGPVYTGTPLPLRAAAVETVPGNSALSSKSRL